MTAETFTHTRRNILRISQRQLAKILGVSPMKISRLETGQVKPTKLVEFAMNWLVLQQEQRD